MGATSSKSKHGSHPLNAPKGYPPYRQGPPMSGYGPGQPNYGQGLTPNYGHGAPVIPFGQGAIGYGQGPPPNYTPGPPNYGRGVIPNNGPVIPQGFGDNYPQVRMPEPQVPHPSQSMQDHQTPRESGAVREARERRAGRQTHERSTRRRRTRKRTLTGTIRIASSGEGQTSTQPIGHNLAGVQPHVHIPASNSASPMGAPAHPAQGSAHRAQTPWHPPSSIEPSNSQGSHSQSSHMSIPQSGPQARTVRYSHTSDTTGGTRTTNPNIPPMRDSSASMPSTTEPRVRAPNPLPEPPRDVYATSPFKHLLTPKELPTTASHNQTAFIKREIITETKPPKKGLFRAFSSKKPALQRSKTIEYVYAPTLSHNSTTSKRSSVMTALHPPASAPAAAPSISRAQAAPQPIIDSDASPDQPIYFDQDSEYSYYLIHSPHPVFHEGLEYPTAAHLLEALKFLPDHPEIAERIRVCDDTEEVYQLSAEYAQHENPDYAPSIVDTMQKVISLKFKQHADLRYKLWNTDPAPLRYNDPSDSFWGIGPTGRGRNELGAVLERVRAEVKPRRR